MKQIDKAPLTFYANEATSKRHIKQFLVQYASIQTGFKNLSHYIQLFIHLIFSMLCGYSLQNNDVFSIHYLLLSRKRFFEIIKEAD